MAMATKIKGEGLQPLLRLKRIQRDRRIATEGQLLNDRMRAAIAEFNRLRSQPAA